MDGGREGREGLAGRAMRGGPGSAADGTAWGASSLRAALRQPRAPTCHHHAPSHAPTLAYAFADIRELRETFLERAAVPLNFLNIGFLVLLKYCLSSFRCERINGVMYMYMSPNDMCYTTKVRQMNPVHALTI